MQAVDQHADNPSAAPESNADYLPRVVDTEIADCMEGLSAVLIEGPRACGKTTTGRHHSRSEVMLGANPTARSAAPADDITRHTGIGRITRVHMRPMSLYESGESSGEVGTGELFDGVTKSAAPTEIDLGDIIEAICRGGWPATTAASLFAAQRYCL